MSALTITTTPRDLRQLPKGHLHLHFEAGMRPETLKDLADRSGVELEVEPDVYADFALFSKIYRSTLAVLKEAAHVERLVDEIAEDAAAEGVAYVEIGTNISFHSELYGGFDGVLEALTSYAQEAGRRHGVEIGLMVTIDRTGPVQVAIDIAQAAAAWAGQGVVSFGLANDERGYPCRTFAEPYAIATSAGLQSTPHAGELVGPESVWEAVDILRADRILHGVTAHEDPRLVETLVERQIGLDICPTSNKLLNVVSDLSMHPLPSLLDAGVPCTINADDPLLFGPNVLEEYELCREQLGMSDEQLAQCALNSVQNTLASESTKSETRRAVENWFNEGRK